MPDLDTENVPQPQRHSQTGQACDKSQQIVFLPDTDHAFEELTTIENADAVQKHDQAGQADWSDDLSLRRERAYRKTDEQDRTDPERKPGDADLADQIAQSDRQKRRQDRLAPDDVACKIQHVSALSPDQPDN